MSTYYIDFGSKRTNHIIECDRIRRRVGRYLAMPDHLPKHITAKARSVVIVCEDGPKWLKKDNQLYMLSRKMLSDKEQQTLMFQILQSEKWSRQ